MLFVDDAIGTYDHADMRYHGRALISANPCIVSVRGMCEAPARPRDYCIDMMACTAAGGDAQEVESRHGGRFLTYDDSRMQEVAHGYVMQAVFHFETGEAFCTDAGCRLYNSHWQSDVITHAGDVAPAVRTTPGCAAAHGGGLPPERLDGQYHLSPISWDAVLL